MFWYIAKPIVSEALASIGGQTSGPKRSSRAPSSARERHDEAAVGRQQCQRGLRAWLWLPVVAEANTMPNQDMPMSRRSCGYCRCSIRALPIMQLTKSQPGPRQSTLYFARSLVANFVQASALPPPGTRSSLPISDLPEQSSCLTRILRRRLLNLFVEFHDAAS